ncbi:MAG: CRISPR system precrRNA processing endoribonuclease RAMP protein Cas6 [Sulfurimonas sp.]|nr:CRISPR system precrRNA processing endoribonuclease RAMP protein Cas6 [Sulfurimonas sp.]
MNYTKISVVIKTDEKVPYFIGSQVRGALGYALKDVTCINPSYICEDCFAKNNCLYWEFYERKNIVHKYRLDIELDKDFYDFNIFIFDDATQKLPYLISALMMMIGKNGLGKDRKTYKKFDIYVNDQLINRDENIEIPTNALKTFQIDKICQDIRLQFLTPLRIKKANKFIKNGDLQIKDLVNSIYQRQMQLTGQKPKRFPYEIEGSIVKKELAFKELTRMSNRQKTTMNMGGLMGSLEIKDLNEKTYNVLKLGELIGVGKQTVFGLGKIKIEDIS